MRFARQTAAVHVMVPVMVCRVSLCLIVAVTAVAHVAAAVVVVVNVAVVVVDVVAVFDFEQEASYPGWDTELYDGVFVLFEHSGEHAGGEETQNTLPHRHHVEDLDDRDGIGVARKRSVDLHLKHCNGILL